MNLFVMLAISPSAEPNPVLQGAFQILSDRGHRVHLGFARDDQPRSLDQDWRDYDLVVLKSRSDYWLSKAEIAEIDGVLVVNSPRGVRLAKNKVVSSKVLFASGEKIPRSWLVQCPQDFPIEVHGPIVIKRLDSERGIGVHEIFDRSDLTAYANNIGPWLVQERLQHDGFDYKIYVIGTQIHGVRKRFHSKSYLDRGEIFSVPNELRERALKAGECLGLTVYGIDFLKVDTEYFAIDINPFPGFRQFPSAAELLADFWIEKATNAQSQIQARYAREETEN